MKDQMAKPVPFMEFSQQPWVSYFDHLANGAAILYFQRVSSCTMKWKSWEIASCILTPVSCMFSIKFCILILKLQIPLYGSTDQEKLNCNLATCWEIWLVSALILLLYNLQLYTVSDEIKVKYGKKYGDNAYISEFCAAGPKTYALFIKDKRTGMLQE